MRLREGFTGKLTVKDAQEVTWERAHVVTRQERAWFGIGKSNKQAAVVKGSPTA